MVAQGAINETLYDAAEFLKKSSGGELDLQEVSVDDAHINTINRMAAKLEKRQSADELLTVRQRRQQLNDRSASLSLPSSPLVVVPPVFTPLEF